MSTEKEDTQAVMDETEKTAVVRCRQRAYTVPADVAFELAMLRQGGIIEVAVRNPSVAEYMKHWEGRAIKAEAALAQSSVDKRYAERLREAILAEPELPGHMPDEMWDAIKNDRDAVEEAMRIAVRQTKEGIIDRAALDLAKKE